MLTANTSTSNRVSITGGERPTQSGSGQACLLPCVALCHRRGFGALIMFEWCRL